jgi:hypothetical protein
MNGNLYKPEYDHVYYFLFETSKDAVSCVRRLKKDFGNVTFTRRDDPWAKDYAAQFGKARNIKVRIVESGKLFLILDCHIHSDTSIYHCIIGEQTGWVPIGTRFKMIKIQ